MDIERASAQAVGTAIVAASTILGVASPAHACSCPTMSLAHDARTAEGVFVGTTRELVDGLRVTRYVEVAAVYKGDPSATVTVNTGQEGPGGEGNSCNFGLPAGRRLVFFAAGAGSEWKAGVCSFPRRPDGKILNELSGMLGPPRDADPPRPQSPVVEPTSGGDESGHAVDPWLIGVGAAAVALAVGTAAFFRRTVGD